jgi:hypothetical protein
VSNSLKNGLLISTFVSVLHEENAIAKRPERIETLKIFFTVSDLKLVYAKLCFLCRPANIMSEKSFGST